MGLEPVQYRVPFLEPLFYRNCRRHENMNSSKAVTLLRDMGNIRHFTNMISWCVLHTYRYCADHINCNFAR